MFEKLSGMLSCLEAAKGSKAKSLLLSQYIMDPDFVWMARAALNQGQSYGIDRFPEFSKTPPGTVVAGGSMVGHIKAWLEDLSKLAGVSDEMVVATHFLACLSEDHYKVITRILRQDLRCGVGAKTINKLSPGLIYRVSYQRCSGFDKIHKMTYPANLQLKANGLFSYILPGGGFLTRAGHHWDIPYNQITVDHANNASLSNLLLIGELNVYENGKPMERAVSNGLLNSFISGSGDPDQKLDVRGRIWGCLRQSEFDAGKSSVPYRKTLEALRKALPDTGSTIQLIDNWDVNDYAEAQAKFKELTAAGEEGGVLKDMSDFFFWQDEDSCDYQIKLKAEFDAEFKLVGAYPGDPGKKYEHHLGGIKVESADGKIVSDVGSGFDDVQRKLGVEYWRGQIGKIVTIKFNGITNNRELPGVHALDHPRFIEMRLDKSEADTLEYCQNGLLGKEAC